MKQVLRSRTVTTGLAIFSMLFGAGNLMFRVEAGLAGGNFIPSMFGFLLGSVVIPFIGLITIILFDGDYRSFFYRVGRIPGAAIIFLCMLVIGPLIAMPRIVTISYLMLNSFLPVHSFVLFACIFLFITFIGAFKESKILDLLGYIVTPILLLTLVVTVIKGFTSPQQVVKVSMNSLGAFSMNVRYGLGTLDLLGAIFFGAIVLSILKQNIKRATYIRVHVLSVVALYAGIIGFGLLTVVYFGMGSLGFLHGAGFEQVHSGILFSNIALRVLGNGGAMIVGIAVVMAGLSTAIALSAVVAEYLQREVCRNRLDYVPALIMVLIATLIFSLLGFDWVSNASNTVVEAIGLPIVITITFANLAYKLFGFKPIKIPVAIVGVYTTSMFVWQLLV
ncbi:MAG TPA: branched-chain amino acid transport system II carrier protein [Candidatus Babeliales bacterium]|nr:branched-chain amino acid transport system II carrier protein [Candidatus Babeliales bacterium]